MASTANILETLDAKLDVLTVNQAVSSEQGSQRALACDARDATTDKRLATLVKRIETLEKESLVRKTQVKLLGALAGSGLLLGGGTVAKLLGLFGSTQ